VIHVVCASRNFSDGRVSEGLDLKALHLVLEGADLRVEVRSFVAFGYVSCSLQTEIGPHSLVIEAEMTGLETPQARPRAILLGT
jgi:hypothetical protein